MYISRIILPFEERKGLMGKVATFGGCSLYTGAPYFSAISALRVGADISRIFCPTSAASPIKSYSPELIVHPYLIESDESDNEEKITRIVNECIAKLSAWETRITSCALGPGMGINIAMQCTALDFILKLKERQMPLVLDADGIMLALNWPEIFSSYKNCIITPNFVEFKRLQQKFAPEENVDDSDGFSALVSIYKKLNGPTILRKGKIDTIIDEYGIILVDLEERLESLRMKEKEGKCEKMSKLKGNGRRCGGQGDLLTGTLAAFTFWALKIGKSIDSDNDITDKKKSSSDQSDSSISLIPTLSSQLPIEETIKQRPMLYAAIAACTVVRRAAKKTWTQIGRGMLASDIISNLAPAIDEIMEEEERFEQEAKKE
ncbi:MAG: putative carbohydrate kinase [Streblomastix strix]|uniref:ATP-dependent (S)-NAD(P)H-hydrate dehydratase n=1 Tax=Streblomastix strix TaxID=222440 RepID=A0A5J4X3B2_9EUKA|nr:MAG: putative carbohydrate kinase [Streblomastix strix]